MVALSSRDVGDLQRRERLPVTRLLAVSLAPPELEDQQLLPEALRHDLRLDLGAGHDGRADLDVLTVGDEQHVVDLDGGAVVTGELLHPDRGAGLDAVLLSACLDHRIHGAGSVFGRSWRSRSFSG